MIWLFDHTRRRRNGHDAAPRGAAPAAGTPGRAVQVDPINPTLKAPGIKQLKLPPDVPPSKLAFKFSLRRYSLARETVEKVLLENNVYTYVEARRCSLTLSNSR